MTPLYGEDETVAAMVASFDPREVDFGACKTIGFLREGRLEAGVVYHDWDPERRRIEISAASVNRRWLTRSNVRAIFAYPFGFCDLVYCRSDHPTVHKCFAAAGGERWDTPVWTILTLTALQWERRLHEIS